MNLILKFTPLLEHAGDATAVMFYFFEGRLSHWSQIQNSQHWFRFNNVTSDFRPLYSSSLYTLITITTDWTNS